MRLFAILQILAFAGSFALLQPTYSWADSAALKRNHAQFESDLTHKKTLRVTVRTGEGIQQLILKRRSSFRASSTTLFQGVVKGRVIDKSPQRAAADLTGDTLTLRFEGRLRSENSRRMWTVKVPFLDLGGRTKSRVLHSTRADGRSTCAEAMIAHDSTHHASSLPDKEINAAFLLSSHPVRVIDIAIDSDAEFAAHFGSATPAAIEGVLNAVEALYLKQLGLAFNVIEIHSFPAETQPYVSTSPIGLLSEFSNYTNQNRHLGSADIYHLFTGKRFFAPENPSVTVPVVGLAFKGTTCRMDGQASFGFTRFYNEATLPLTAAHEIAHNLDASHDLTGGSIMAPIAPPPQTIFSSTSQNEIQSYIANFGDCLSFGERSFETEEVPTAPPEVSISATVSKQRVLRLEAELSGSSTAQCNLELFASTNVGDLDYESLPNARKLASLPIGQGAVRVRSQISPTLRRALFLRATVTCEGAEPVVTDIVRVAPVKQKQLRLSQNAWF